MDKIYLCTIFGSTSTRENPVEPKSVTVFDKDLLRFISEKVDSSHYVFIGLVPSFDYSCDDDKCDID